MALTKPSGFVTYQCSTHQSSLSFDPLRYQCHHCEGKPTTTQRLSWHELRSPNTKPYEKWLLRMLVNSTVADVARKLELSDETVTGVLDRWVTTQVNWDEFERIEIVGLDEIAQRARPEATMLSW